MADDVDREAADDRTVHHAGCILLDIGQVVLTADLRPAVAIAAEVEDRAVHVDAGAGVGDEPRHAVRGAHHPAQLRTPAARHLGMMAVLIGHQCRGDDGRAPACARPGVVEGARARNRSGRAARSRAGGIRGCAPCRVGRGRGRRGRGVIGTATCASGRVIRTGHQRDCEDGRATHHGSMVPRGAAGAADRRRPPHYAIRSNPNNRPSGCSRPSMRARRRPPPSML